MISTQQTTKQTIMGFAKGNKKYLAFAIIAVLISILFNFLTPQVIRFTVDSVIGEEPSALPRFLNELIEARGGRDFMRSNLVLCAIGVVACALVNGVFNFISRMGIATFTQRFIKNMRDTLFEHTQHLPFEWHTQNKTGDIIQRCTSDVDVVRNFIANQLLQIIRTVTLVTIALVLMFSMNVKLTLVALIFLPLTAAYSGYFFAKIRRKFRIADDAEGELTVAVQENLTGVRVVRAFGREKYELDKFDKRNRNYAKLWMDMGYVNGFYWGIGDLMTGLQVLSVIVCGSILAAQGHLTLGEFIVFVSYNQTLAWPVRALGRTLSDLSKTGVSLDRIRKILLAPAEKPEPNGKEPDMRGDITFENVTFGYNDTKVLKNVSFNVERGKTFGVLGATGSGKSTITYLLNRLYDLPKDGGSIKVSGIDIRDIERSYLRHNVGVVLQEPFLFSKTIGENIAIATPGCDESLIRHSAQIAAVDDSIIGFANGYDTIVGERGVTLSGGQKQRVAIARTLMQHAPIMVFDDSMSAVDLETDAQIRDALRSDTGDSTVILISHRINTLMQADKIMVLDNGEIAEIGTHEELMANGGAYRRIYDMQSKATSDLLIEEEA